jgi:hypothetical protein
MEICKCIYCNSNSLNLIAVKVKRYCQKNVEIKEQYVTIKDAEAIKHYFKCNMCSKYSEYILTNKKGFVISNNQKHKDTEPQNEILAIEEGGRFN